MFLRSLNILTQKLRFQEKAREGEERENEAKVECLCDFPLVVRRGGRTNAVPSYFDANLGANNAESVGIGGRSIARSSMFRFAD